MTIKNKILPMLAMAIVSACSDPGSGDISERAVVEAYLRPGSPMEVTISKEGLFENGTIDTLEFIDGLTVRINEGDNSYTLQSIGDGKYVSGERVIVVSEKIYSLDFEYGNKEVSASTYVPSSPKGFELSAYEIDIVRPVPGSNPGTAPIRPEPIEVSWENPDNDYHLVVVTVIEKDPEEIAESGFVFSGGSFRNEPNTGTTYQINQRSFEYYGMHAVILYKLNPEYATLYEESGNSSLNLKSPYSNVINGLGIFTGVNPDTLYLHVKKP
jgi:hypothetical protein